MRNIEKYIFGLSCDLDSVHYDIKNDFITFFKIDKVKFASNIRLTINHNADRVIADTKNNDLKLVQLGSLLFFRLRVDNEKHLEAYNSVLNGKLKHCSYMIRKTNVTPCNDIMKSFKDNSNDRFEMVEGVVFEICLTDSPRDANTFATTDRQHALIRNIDWSKSVELTETKDYWHEFLEFEEISMELEDLGKMLNKVNERLLKLK